MNASARGWRRAAMVGAGGLLLAACATPTSAPPSGVASGSGTAPASTSAAATAAGGAPAAPIARTLVRYGVPGIDLSVLPISAASWKGYFQDEGLDVEVVRVGGQAAVPSLLNGEIGYTFGWGSVSAGMVQGAPIKVVGVLLDRPPHVIVTQPSIETVADLRGKRLGISRAGSADQQVFERALQQVGVRLADAELLRLGDTNTRYSALTANQLEATTLIQPYTMEAEKQGYRVLARGSDLLQLPLGVVAVSQAQLDGKSDEVRRLLRGLARSLAYVHDPANRAELLQLAAEHFQLEPALTPTLVDDTLRITTRDGETSTAALEAALDDARAQVERAEPRPFGALIDFALLRQARQELGLR